MTRADDSDEWGRDPAVINMRRVFAAIEAAQTAFLASLSIETLDSRLGSRPQLVGRSQKRAGGVSRKIGHLVERPPAGTSVFERTLPGGEGFKVGRRACPERRTVGQNLLEPGQERIDVRRLPNAQGEDGRQCRVTAFLQETGLGGRRSGNKGLESSEPLRSLTQ